MKKNVLISAIVLLSSSLLPLSHTPYQAGVFAMQGKRPTMEDRHTIAWNFDGKENHHFFGIYDGHGGDKAADFVANNLHHEIAACSQKDTKKRIKLAVAMIEKKLLNKTSHQHFNDGTCAIFALLENRQLIIGNIGDSRAVLCQDGKAIALSSDQKPDRFDEKKRIENAGGSIIKMGVWRTPGGLAISRALGDARLKKNRFVIAVPEITTTTLHENDEFIILACDGVWDVVNNQTAVNIVQKSLAHNNDASLASQALAQYAYDHGSTDNISVLVITLK